MQEALSGTFKNIVMAQKIQKLMYMDLIEASGWCTQDPPSFHTHVEKGTGIAVTYMKQKGERAGGECQLTFKYLYRSMWKTQRCVLMLFMELLPLGPPSTCMVSSAALEFRVSFPWLPVTVSTAPSQLVIFHSCQWACIGRGGCFSQPQILR